MADLKREVIFLILKHLDGEKYKEAVHKLEQESGVFFNMKYMEEIAMKGEWEEADKYLSGFTKYDDNKMSMKCFFEIRKQNYLEALDRGDISKALEILMKDLKVFSTAFPDTYEEMTQILALNNFRENESLAKYGDTQHARVIVFNELKTLIEGNLLFHDKLQFPAVDNLRLMALMNQSFYYQHILCQNPRPDPLFETLYEDHTCWPPNGARTPSPITNPLIGSIPNPVSAFPLLRTLPFSFHAPSSSLGGRLSNASSLQLPAVSQSQIGLRPPNHNAVNAALLMRPRTPNNNFVDYQSADIHVLKRSRPLGMSNEVNNSPIDILTMAHATQNHTQSTKVPEELPKIVVTTLNLGSGVRSMDFHPVQHALLLGYVLLIYERAFAEKPAISVNRVLWSPDGALIGVAFSLHLVHLYSSRNGENLREHLEIDAHTGAVNDLAFFHQNKQLRVITCGDDKAINVWDAFTGSLRGTFGFLEASVISLGLLHKENIQYFFSTSMDGKIQAWFGDYWHPKFKCDVPGKFCTTLACSADGTRLFSCGTSKEGDSYLAEWIESEGVIKQRYYQGFDCKRSFGVLQFDTTRNHFLAVGDDFKIKIWDMNHSNLLTTVEADGGLPASPRIRFNKEGTLLAVSTNDNGVKILASADGLRLLHGIEDLRDSSQSVVKVPPVSNLGAAKAITGLSFGVSNRIASLVSILGQNGDHPSLADAQPKTVKESTENSKVWKPNEINKPSQCRSLRLPDNLLKSKVSRLMYTNSGAALLALTSDAVHKLWKWQRNEHNQTGKATSNVPPQLWQPSSGVLMTNEISDTNPADAVPCFALSKNGWYVMSASGGKISIFNILTFKKMTTFMPPPPAATFLAFHPQDNNIIALGMDDCTILIYNIRYDDVISKLKGHQVRITGLAFSRALNVLVSSGADSHLCVWNTDRWEKQASNFLQIPPGRAMVSETSVQFHQVQIQFLCVHETQVAIYEVYKLERLNQWLPQDSWLPITHATYSCDSQSIYVSFADGSVAVLFAATLQLRCRILSSVYIPSNISSNSGRVHPLVIAAHPSKPNQIALGMTNGAVHVLEPLESEGNWCTELSLENGAEASIPPVEDVSNQLTR
ncbi:hypothetical protein Sjap_011157 [Stephania japonica]|uniref:CTLH domain-containing protein n=1 Tax=Stephania japonica TaxID=461633 RepID=A0AAP0JBW0_9MAGN